jgi:hypothetical protein
VLFSIPVRQKAASPKAVAQGADTVITMLPSKFVWVKKRRRKKKKDFLTKTIGSLALVVP